MHGWRRELEVRRQRTCFTLRIPNPTSETEVSLATCTKGQSWRGQFARNWPVEAKLWGSVRCWDAPGLLLLASRSTSGSIVKPLLVAWIRLMKNDALALYSLQLSVTRADFQHCRPVQTPMVQKTSLLVEHAPLLSYAGASARPARQRQAPPATHQPAMSCAWWGGGRGPGAARGPAAGRNRQAATAGCPGE